MRAEQVIVVLGAAAAMAGLGWFFFGPRKARAADLAGGVQRATVTVRGGYSPEVVRVLQGLPVELIFDRQESGDCTSRVVFPDFRVGAALPAYQQTTVRLDPQEAGEFAFACGMNMIHGSLIVEPVPGGAGSAARPTDPARSRTDRRRPVLRRLPHAGRAGGGHTMRWTRRRRSGGPRSGTWRFASSSARC